MSLVTWSSTDKTYWTVSGDLLTASIVSNEYASNFIRATKGVSSGKWYWEVKLISGSGCSSMLVGISASGGTGYNSPNTRTYFATGIKHPANQAYGTTYGAGDTIGVSLDMDAGTLTFYKNGVSQGVAYTDIKTLGTVYPHISCGTNGGAVVNALANFGASSFAYPAVFSTLDGYSSYDENQSSTQLLIKKDGLFYSIKPEYYNTTTHEYTALESADFTKGFLVTELFIDKTVGADTFKPITKFDNFQLVTQKPTLNFKVRGLKSTKQMVVASDDISASIADHIDSFTLDQVSLGGGSLRLVISTDKGLTWKTWNTTSGTFEPIALTIPLKPYNTLTADELTQWNSAMDSILASGISPATFNTLDFNLLGFSTIRLAYALSRPVFSDSAETTQLNWQFDAKGSMRKLTDAEHTVDIYESEIKVTSLIANSAIKVNVIS